MTPINRPRDRFLCRSLEYGVISVSFIHWTAVYLHVYPAITLIVIDFLFGCQSGSNPRISVSQTDYFRIAAASAAERKYCVPGTEKHHMHLSAIRLLFLLVSMFCIIPSSLCGFEVSVKAWKPGPPRLKHPRGYEDVDTANQFNGNPICSQLTGTAHSREHMSSAHWRFLKTV